jgi:hypothetical protein
MGGSMNAIPSPPRISPPIVDNIPPELKALPQWVVWKLAWRPGKGDQPGKWTKVPHRADTGAPASSTDPVTWASFDAAIRAYQLGRSKWAGIGFVFDPDDPYIGIDLDGCRDPQTGQLTPEALEWVSRFGTYTEVSPSQTGVKLIALGALPEGMSGRRDATLGVECYDQGRFFTVTGQRLSGSPQTCEGAPEALRAFLAKHFPKAEPKPQAAPRPVEPLDMSDAELLAKAFAAKDGAKFSALWNGSLAGYPGSSEADMALAGLLLFWTQGDAPRTESLMRRSQLYRDKWDEKRGQGTYLSYTVEKALEGKSEFYKPKSGNFVKNATSPLRVNRNIEEEEEEPYLPSISDNLTKLTKLDWEGDPVSFGQENLVPFPSWALPSVLKDFSEQVAANVGTSPDLPGVQLLAAVAAAVQKRVSVVGKPGHVEPLTLWCIGISPPGSRKSAIMGHIRKPFTVTEVRENESRRPEVEEFESRERVAKARLGRAETAAAKGNPSIEVQAELDTARRNVSDLKPVRPLRLLADDATPEVLALMLSENEGRLAVLDAEGAAFGHMIGRYSQNPAIEIYLKAHAGEDHTTDRAGGAGTARRTVSVPQAALTIGCAVQPEVLADLRKKKELAGRGALARCLFSFSEDTDAADEYDTPDLAPDVTSRYRALIEGLLTLSPSLDRGEDGQPIPHMVGLECEARSLFTEFYREIRQKIREEGEGLFAEWLAKLHGAVLRLAGVLHMAKHGRIGAELGIDAETMAGAIELARYFSEHARAALARIREDEASEGALKILGWVKRNREQVAKLTEDQGGVSLRDLKRQLRTFDTQEELEASLYALAARGYAQEVPIPEREEGTRGRKPTARWQFHPSLTWSVEV